MLSNYRSIAETFWKNQILDRESLISIVDIYVTIDFYEFIDETFFFFFFFLLGKIGFFSYLEDNDVVEV